MISYAGVELGEASEALLDWIERTVPPRVIWDFAARSTPGPGLLHLDMLPQPPYQPVRPGRLYWPTGATRFAVGHYLADPDELEAIRAVVFTDSDSDGTADTYAAADLVLADGVSSVTTSLYMLPARPLAQIAGETVTEGLHLLTLVDDRFFWWYRPGAISITAGTTTWAQLYAQIVGFLGITLTVDTIPSSYLKPPAELAVQYEALPVLLDAVARCLGQRIVRQLDGTVRAWNASQSVSQQASNLELLDEDDGPDVAGGGILDLEESG